MPPGLLVTFPGPAVVTDSGYEVGGATLKAAPTVTGVLPVTVQLPVPAQPPPVHPPNVEPFPGVAESVTTVLLVYVSTQSTPQLIPAGLLLTVPWPVPLRVIVRAKPVDVTPQASFE